VPTLILCGKEDKLTPLRYSEFLRDQIPSAELQVVERAGHMVMLEEPLIVAGVLADFLNKIPYQPGR
jgi:pimeloyl-ACP methyl ester carboxylesterase